MEQSKCDDDLRVHLPADVKAALRKLAEREDRTLSAYMRRMCIEHVTLAIHRRKVEGPNRAT